MQRSLCKERRRSISRQANLHGKRIREAACSTYRARAEILKAAGHPCDHKHTRKPEKSTCWTCPIVVDVCFTAHVENVPTDANPMDGPEKNPSTVGVNEPTTKGCHQMSRELRENHKVPATLCITEVMLIRETIGISAALLCAVQRPRDDTHSRVLRPSRALACVRRPCPCLLFTID